MADKLIDVNALLRGDDSMFDRSFSVVAVRHADGSPFTEANPPTRFRAYLSNGWLNGAGSNRLLGGYVMATGMRAMLGFSKRWVRGRTGDRVDLPRILINLPDWVSHIKSRISRCCCCGIRLLFIRSRR